MKLSLAASAVFVACLAPGFAHAEIFDWSYGGNTVTASGQLTATLVSSGAFDTYSVTALTGTRNGKDITFTPCASAVCLFADGSTFDDLIYIGGVSQLSGIGSPSTNYGLAITTSDGIFNPYYNDGTYGQPVGDYEYTVGSGSIPGANIDTFTVTPTPEPGTFALLGGALLTGYFARRRINR